MVSIYSFGRPLSLPDIDDDGGYDEDVGIYLETTCFKCQKSSKKVETLTEKVQSLQTILYDRENHLKVCILKRLKYVLMSFKTLSVIKSISKMPRSI